MANRKIKNYNILLFIITMETKHIYIYIDLKHQEEFFESQENLEKMFRGI